MNVVGVQLAGVIMFCCVKCDCGRYSVGAFDRVCF